LYRTASILPQYWHPTEILYWLKVTKSCQSDEIEAKNDEIDEIEENEGENNDEDANPVGLNNNDKENDDMKEYDENLFDYEVAQTTQKTRSVRITIAPDRLNFIQNHIFTQGHKERLYSLVTAQVIAKTMDYLINLVLSTKKDRKYSFVLTYSIKKGLKKYGKKGYDAAFGEMKQLHDMIVLLSVQSTYMI
jgi:hypothetical protein